MSPKLVLVFGASGMLGGALCKELEQAGHVVRAPHETEIDITDQARISGYVKAGRPDVIFNCAAFTRVDDCEKQRELAWKVNAEGAGNIARAAKAIGASVFYISTDYIFPGDKPGVYEEDDKPGPLNYYGETKLEGEVMTQKEAGQFCIFRTSWLFGPGGENFITKVLKKTNQGARELKVVADERGCPTYSRDLAHALRLAVEKELRGTYHFCNQGAVSWYEFAGEIFEITGNRPGLTPVTAEQYGLPAKRPKNSVLSTAKIEAALGLTIRHHKDALREYLEKFKTGEH